MVTLGRHTLVDAGKAHASTTGENSKNQEDPFVLQYIGRGL